MNNRAFDVLALAIGLGALLAIAKAKAAAPPPVPRMPSAAEIFGAEVQPPTI